MKNYYDILGISTTATKEQIKSAYRKLSVKFHPDKNNGEEFFESMFKNINEAHEILIDDRKKVNYDLQLKRFNETRNDYNQADVKRKEEELRRKQEELLRKEQELRQREFSKEAELERPNESSETDWRTIATYFWVLNSILVLLIFITPHKDEKFPTVRENSSSTIKERVIRNRPNKKSVSSEKSVIDSVDNNVIYSVDTTMNLKMNSELQANSVTSTDTVTENNNSEIRENNGQADTIAEKPKWFQFKKKRELKKKNQKEKETY